MLVLFHPLQTFSAADMSTSTSNIYPHLQRLPRELRDMIYVDVVKQELPIRLGYAEPHVITNPFHSNAVIAAEALEAFYRCNTFIISFEDDPKARPLARQHWKYHPFFPVLRYLIIEATESSINPEQADLEHFESLYWGTLARNNWTSLLSLVHLKYLEVRLEKRNSRNVSTFDFGPILRELEHRASPPVIKVLVNLDKLLEKAWDDSYWDQHNRTQSLGQFEPAGFFDCTELFALPSAEDEVFVTERFPVDREMPLGRPIIEGLMSSNVESRQLLSKHYVVKEPSLLRVLMSEHWIIWKKRNMKQDGEFD